MGVLVEAKFLCNSAVVEGFKDLCDQYPDKQNFCSSQVVEIKRTEIMEDLMTLLQILT